MGLHGTPVSWLSRLATHSSSTNLNQALGLVVGLQNLHTRSLVSWNRKGVVTRGGWEV